MNTYGESDFRRLRSTGAAGLPTNPVRARIEAQNMRTAAGSSGMLDAEVRAALQPTQSRGRLDGFGLGRMVNASGYSPQQADLIRSMGAQRQGSSSNFQMSLNQGIMRDPFEYWEKRSHYFDPEDEDADNMQRIRRWCRMIYSTHYLMPSMIDIYTRFPLQDIELYHRDEQIAEFHNDLFFDQLDYYTHLFNLGREHWVVGEVFSMGSWHEGIGAWENDEIINPDDVRVSENRILRSKDYAIKVPEDIRTIIQTREPREQFNMLVELYPDLVGWAMRDVEIPVSDVLMKQIKFTTTPWKQRGTPILMRAFRMLMMEESLNAAQDAVADRLYSPFILARLGLDDVDQEGPWIPDPVELDLLRNDINMALASDFRLMVYHHGLQLENVFGREQMPRLDQDFDRIESKLMLVFGIGEDLLRGGSSNATYASGALNRELITQLLETYQRDVEKFLRDRMEPVAERHAHYEYEKKGDRRIPIMETVLLVDEVTGEEYIQERPKLAIPEVRFKAMNLRDEKVEREFLARLKDNGVPISDQSLAINIPFEFNDELERSMDETVRKVVAEQEMKANLFKRLHSKNLPVPPDYKEEYDLWLAGQQTGNPETDGIPGEDAGGLAAAPGLEGAIPMNPDSANMVPPPDLDFSDYDTEEGGETRPDESDEMREDMPQQASRIARAEVQDQPMRPVSYGNEDAFGTPGFMKLRRKARLNPAMLHDIRYDDEPRQGTKDQDDKIQMDADEFLDQIRRD